MVDEAAEGLVDVLGELIPIRNGEYVNCEPGKTGKLSKNTAILDHTHENHGVDIPCSHETSTGLSDELCLRNICNAAGGTCPS